MRAHIRVRSKKTKLQAGETVPFGGASHGVDEDGWVHVYDVGSFELRKLIKAFPEVEVVEWGDLDRTAYRPEKAKMKELLNA